MTPFDRVALYFALLFLCGALGGCSLITAEKAVTGCYTGVGATAVVSRPALQECENKAIADKSQPEMDQCAKGQRALAEALPIAQDGCHVAANGVKAYALLKAKNYAGALAPMYAGLLKLADALKVANIKLPVSLPGVK